MLLRLYTFLFICCLGGFGLPDVAAQCSLSTSPSPATCQSTDGSIQVTVSGGLPGYAYSYSNGTTSGNGTAGNDVFTITGLEAGNYGITVTDASNCTSTATATVDATASTIVLSTQVTNTCATSLIDLTATGGTAPYSYTWSNGSTTPDLNFLVAGTYTVTVYDNNGCSQTTSETVGAPASLFLFKTTTNVSCFDINDGAIDVTVSGGATPYTYLWSNNQVVPDLTGLAAGTYTLTVTDNAGCTGTLSSTITQPSEIGIQFSIIPVLCFGGSGGGIDLTVTGGTAPYTYLWNNGVNVEDLTNVQAGGGAYSVTVTDANGCTKSLGNVALVQPPAITSNFTAITPVSCSGGSDGAVDLTVTGGTPGYIYQWSTGANTQDLSGLAAGTYTVSVTDANGCTHLDVVTVTQPTPLSLQTLVQPPSCTALNSGFIDLTVTGGTAPYLYHWSDGAQTQDKGNLAAGTYTVTVTDINNCTASKTVIVAQPPALTVNPTVTYSDCATAVADPHVSGGTAPYSYTWSNGVSGPLIIVPLSGNYSITITDANGCTAVAEFEIEISGNGLCGILEGDVIHDTTENCLNDAEPGLSNWIVRAVGTATYYGMTDSAGHYRIYVQPGTYTLSTVLPNALWESCPDPVTATLSQPNDTTAVGDLLEQSVSICPALTVEIATGQLRRCFNSFYTVDYCNQGTSAAENAYVIVQLDPYLSVQSASIPYQVLGNGQLRFNVGDLAIGDCGSFQIYVVVSCSSTLGQTHCTEAHIYPDGSCLPPNGQWSGASLQVNSVCSGDSLHFIIKNVGNGNLSETVNYIVIEDQVMLMQAPVPALAAGESVQVVVPANGSTWRMEVQQAAFHPGLSQPALSVEGCSATGVFATGFVSQFPTNDADPWLDIDCTINVGSFDPNDKQGFPAGYGTEHFIRPGTDLEYKIRFQNTGTDTAFNILVVDTLAKWLDPATVKPGPSSHPYHFELYGPGILKFHFDDILLPDSNVNEAASHGFLQFRISPYPGAPLETLIENQAQIFFDFNDAVVTNTTFHRLGEQFVLTTDSWQPHIPGAQVWVVPNPFDDQARLEVKGLTTDSALYLEVFDLQGNRVGMMTSDNAVFFLKKGNWPAGVYLFRITQKGRPVGTGKLLAR